MNNLKMFEQWVSNNLGSSVNIGELNRLLNDKRLSETVIKNFHSLKLPYKKALLSFVENKTLDLSKMLKIIKRFKLIEKFKRKKGNLNDKIEQVSQEIETTNEEFFFEVIVILVAIILTCFLLGSGIILIFQGLRENDGSLMPGILAICVWILLAGFFGMPLKVTWETMKDDSEKQKTEQSKKTDNMTMDSDTTIVKQVKTDSGNIINLIIIKKGDTYFVEEVK